MQISLAIVKSLNEFKLHNVFKDDYFAILVDNKLVVFYRKEKILLNSIIFSKQIYLEYNKYFLNDNKLLTYEEILERDKNFIRIDAKLLVDLLNKCMQTEKFKVFKIIIFKLKNKCYLNLITPNYYYIFRFKNNNFNLIKTFKYWNNFALDEKNNLYFINGIMQFYRVSKSFRRYKEFINLVNNNYSKLISIYLFNKRYYNFNIYCLNYKFSYKKNIIYLYMNKIFGINNIIMEINNKKIFLKDSSKYFHIAFTI